VLLEQFEDAQCFDILGGVSGGGEIAGGELMGFAGGLQAAVVGVEGGVAGMVVGLERLAGHRAIRTTCLSEWSNLHGGRCRCQCCRRQEVGMEERRGSSVHVFIVKLKVGPVTAAGEVTLQWSC